VVEEEEDDLGMGELSSSGWCDVSAN
jgi:hypothetical protein